jgi:1-hydroxycarotenoid 3,4-desaturase
MKAIVVGAGLGGLAAAIELAAAGLDVTVVESGSRAGGKAAPQTVNGIDVDTGPSVLTLPEVFDAVFQAAGSRFDAEVTLRRLDPGFRYLWPDGAQVDVFHDPADTVASVRGALGGRAASDLERFLAYAKRIWDAAAPHFVYGDAPTAWSMLWKAPRLLRQVAAVDPLRTMHKAVQQQVHEPHLRDLLLRYATYNGSDARTAPATLNCIAHVELALGAWGIEGGIGALVDAFERVARRLGVAFLFDTPVRRLQTRGRAVTGVILDGASLTADVVVCNADVAHLATELLPSPLRRGGPSPPRVPSMSGWVGIMAAAPRERVAHTVLFPEVYDEEFADLFDRDRPPADPTVYLCAQDLAHGRTGWGAAMPLFLMANAPPEPVQGRRGELAQRFPGSRGSLYGAASNTQLAAFQRPPNRVAALPGLYLASGSAHPGGGMPMVTQSGRAAAAAVLNDLGVARRTA